MKESIVKVIVKLRVESGFSDSYESAERGYNVILELENEFFEMFIESGRFTEEQKEFMRMERMKYADLKK